MYLTHHYLIDVVGGGCLATFFFYYLMPAELREWESGGVGRIEEYDLLDRESSSSPLFDLPLKPSTPLFPRSASAFSSCRADLSISFFSTCQTLEPSLLLTSTTTWTTRSGSSRRVKRTNLPLQPQSTSPSLPPPSQDPRVRPPWREAALPSLLGRLARGRHREGRSERGGRTRREGYVALSWSLRVAWRSAINGGRNRLQGRRVWEGWWERGWEEARSGRVFARLFCSASSAPFALL